jgi:diguanylate cyclase (GGDEF)-like protein
MSMMSRAWPVRDLVPMPRRTPKPHLLRHRRTALVAGALVILALAGFAVWAARQNQASVDRVRTLTTISDAYQQARHAVAQEDLAARGYRLEPNHEQAEAFAQADASLSSALAVVRAQEPAGAGKVDQRVTADNRAAEAWFAQLQEAATANDYRRVVEIDDHHLQPLFLAMTAMLDRAGAEHHSLALASLRDSQRSERMVLAAVAVTIALGLLLLTSTSATMRYRERLERIRGREVERLKRAALIDNLTSLGNHRAFEEDLERALDDASVSGASLTLALLDLDGLKQINDLHGHQAGDECIRALAGVLANAGSTVGAYRIGGDEFALIVPGRRAVDTLYLIQHLQSNMARGNDRPASASSGVAEASAGLGRDALIRRADLALIQAKRSHRRCLLYNEALEPILAGPDAIAEQRHTDALATALARAVDAKDSYTHSHCETVSELCALIGQELGMPPDRVTKLRLAGLLHDVGKIGITDSILQKPGPLTEAEFSVMKTHTRLGYAIVTAAERPEEADWILHHHERIDGSGYPDGLAGDQIPIESRIILVADAFEAITADRPYRRHRSPEVALAELARCSGTQFDAGCVDALRRCVTGGLREAA